MKKISTLILFISGITAILSWQTQTPTVKASIVRGKELYPQYCLSCHQADGSGVPRMNPPLIKTSYVTGNKKKMIQWVLKGSVENIPIDGEYYSNNMAAQSYLTDVQIADILTYIRNSFGNKASAVTASEVKAVRAVTK